MTNSNVLATEGLTLTASNDVSQQEKTLVKRAVDDVKKRLAGCTINLGESDLRGVSGVLFDALETEDPAKAAARVEELQREEAALPPDIHYGVRHAIKKMIKYLLQE